MNKLILAIALTLATSVAMVRAEDVSTASGGPSFEKMQDKLGLTDEQVTEMRTIRDAGGSREEMKAVLTPEQQAKMAGHMKGNPDSGNRMARMKEHLGLSDEQVAQIKEIKQGGGGPDEIRAVLTPDQQAKFDEKRGQR